MGPIPSAQQCTGERFEQLPNHGFILRAKGLNTAFPHRGKQLNVGFDASNDARRIVRTETIKDVVPTFQEHTDSISHRGGVAPSPCNLTEGLEVCGAAILPLAVGDYGSLELSPTWDTKGF